MGEAFICRRGGQSAQAAVSSCAIICAKFPAGSSCTCMRGSTRFDVQEASGLVAFAVPESGTWTVSISDGTQSSSGTVSIASAGEVKTIQLSYAAAPSVGGSGTILSAQGGLAAGYAVSGNAGVSGSKIVESDSGGFWLSPAVDLRGYSRLTVTGTARFVSYGYSRICVGSTPEKVFDIAQTPELYADWTGSPDTAYSMSINISALNGTYYIGSASVGNRLEITGIVLS